MMKYLFGVLLLLAPVFGLADSHNCDLSAFRWQCEIEVQEQPAKHRLSILDCNGSNVYVTAKEYEQVMRYQRASVHFALKVNGEWLTGPCTPLQYRPEYAFHHHRHPPLHHRYYHYYSEERQKAELRPSTPPLAFDSDF